MVTHPRADVAWREPRCGWFGPRRGPWRSGPAAAAAYLAREQEAGRWWWWWQCLGGGWGPSGILRNGAMMAISLHVFQVVPAVVTCFSSRQDRLFVASAKCLGLLRGYFDSRPEVLGQYGATGPKRLIRALLGCVMLGATLVNVSVLFMWVIVTFMGMTTCLKFIEICWKSFLCCLFPLHSGGAGAEWLWCTSYASYAS